MTRRTSQTFEGSPQKTEQIVREHGLWRVTNGLDPGLARELIARYLFRFMS